MAVVAKLELRGTDFFPKLFANESLSISCISATSFRFSRFLWDAIGANEEEDRSGWSAGQWQHYLTDPRCEFYAVFCDEEPAGCVELVREPVLMRASSSAVRIKAFGLFPEFTGEGLGSSLLTRIVEKALATGAGRVTFRSGQPLPADLLHLFRNQGFRILTTDK